MKKRKRWIKWYKKKRSSVKLQWRWCSLFPWGLQGPSSCSVRAQATFRRSDSVFFLYCPMLFKIRLGLHTLTVYVIHCVEELQNLGRTQPGNEVELNHLEKIPHHPSVHTSFTYLQSSMIMFQPAQCLISVWYAHCYNNIWSCLTWISCYNVIRIRRERKIDRGKKKGFWIPSCAAVMP